MAKKLRLKKKSSLKGIKAAQAATAKMREEGVVVKREYNLMVRAKKNPNSKIKAIHAQCFNCMGGTIDDLPDGGWKNEIRNCSSEICPLVQFRPFKPNDNEDDE